MREAHLLRSKGQQLRLARARRAQLPALLAVERADRFFVVDRDLEARLVRALHLQHERHRVGRAAGAQMPNPNHRLDLAPGLQPSPRGQVLLQDLAHVEPGRCPGLRPCDGCRRQPREQRRHQSDAPDHRRVLFQYPNCIALEEDLLTLTVQLPQAGARCQHFGQINRIRRCRRFSSKPRLRRSASRWVYACGFANTASSSFGLIEAFSMIILWVSE
jgi:hypothetical protein